MKIINIFVISFLLLALSCGKTSEKDLWQNAKQENTIEAFQNFINQYPESEYIDSAKIYIEILQDSIERNEALMQENQKNQADEKIWKSIDTTSLDALYDFIENNPDNSYIKNAKNRVIVIIKNSDSYKALLDDFFTTLDSSEKYEDLKKYLAEDFIYINDQTEWDYGIDTILVTDSASFENINFYNIVEQYKNNGIDIINYDFDNTPMDTTFIEVKYLYAPHGFKFVYELPDGEQTLTFKFIDGKLYLTEILYYAYYADV